jgi:hypothetical protein
MKPAKPRAALAEWAPSDADPVAGWFALAATARKTQPKAFTKKTPRCRAARAAR